MTIDWNKPIETTSGKPAKAVSRDFKSPNRGFDVVVQFEEDCESRLGFYMQDGRPVYAGPLLRNKTKKVTKWYNLYADKPGLMYMDNEEMARRSTLDGKPPIATLSTEIEVPCD
jgi:hypothetical protein